MLDRSSALLRQQPGATTATIRKELAADQGSAARAQHYP